ncbi:MAG: hypothetical protein CMN29_04040 [Sandaracinus sp.]|nr:hypothetical protein [Sandaracinus sp.]
MLAPMDAVDSLRTLRARFAESPSARALEAAIGAARAGEGEAVAEALAPLGEPERLFATVALGALFPAAAGAPARALEDALAASTMRLDWSRLVEQPLMRAFAEALVDAGELALAKALVGRAWYGQAGFVLERLVARALEAGDATDARALFEGISDMAKADRAAARARMGLAAGPDGEADLHAAVAHAHAEPIIENGGEEVEALARLLEVLAPLPPEHPAVEAAVRAIGALVDRFLAQKDQRSHGTGLAAEACARAARPDAPGWLDHARALARITHHPEPKAAAEEAIAAAAQRLEAGEAATLEERSHAPVRLEPAPLEALRQEEHFAQRARDASTHLADALAAGDLEAALGALRVAIEPGPAGTPEADEQLRYLAALGAASGEAAAAYARHVMETFRWRSGARGVPKGYWDAVLEAGVGGEDGRALVREAIGLGLHFQIENNMPAKTVGRPLGVLAGGDPELEEALLRAIVEKTDHEKKHPGHATRIDRIGGCVAGLAEHAAGPERLEAWAAILEEADELARLAGVAKMLAPLGLEEARRCCGGAIVRPEGVAMAKALAEAGRFEEALELAEALGTHRRRRSAAEKSRDAPGEPSPDWKESPDPRTQRAALLAIAEVKLGAKERKKLVARFEKAPRARDRDSQGVYKHQLGEVLLGAGDVDRALKVLAKMKDCRVAGRGPAYLARAVERWLAAHPEEASPERVGAVLEALASKRVIAQCLADVVHESVRQLAALAPAEVEARLGALRGQFRGSGDQALVDAGWAAALYEAGDEARGQAAFEGVLEKVRGTRIHFWSEALFSAATAAGLVEKAPELFARVIETFPLGRYPNAHDAVGRLDDAGRRALPGLLERLPAPSAEALRLALARHAGEHGDAALALAAMEGASSASEVDRLGRRLACALARGGALEEARAVAREAGLAR